MNEHPKSAGLSDPATVTPDAIMQLGLGFMASKVLLSAIEVGLFTALGAGPLDDETLRARLSLHPRSHRDFLDALVALGMLEKRGGRYANTPATGHFLDRNGPGYAGGFLEMANARLYGFWDTLTDGLRTGEPQNEAKTGGDLFEALYSDTDALKAFLAAMTGLSLGTGRALAQKFPWGDYRSFVDVGCAEGGVPVSIAAAYPHLTGTGFELPGVQPHFEAYVARHGLADRLRFMAGDFFADPFPRADVIVMGHILHDWDLERKRQLIAKAYEALPSGGAFIAFEPIIDNDRRGNVVGLLTSLNMLIETRGGFDYTFADCEGWFKDAGFRETRREHLAGPESMVIGIK
jgi:SAM-dependent methyltransferase